MTLVQKLSVDEIEDLAAEFLARRRYSDWGSSEQTELENWLNASLSHRVAFWRLEATLARTERLAALQQASMISKGNSAKSAFKLRFGAAVAVVSAVIIGAGLYFVPSSETVYSTPVGGHEILHLADGSTIELNTNTVLRLRADSRSAKLDSGEAYFQIKHDAARPFSVTVSGHRVVDIGTKFLIRTEQQRFEVSLLEGLARLDAGREHRGVSSTLLKPGDVAVGRGTFLKVVRKPITTVARELGWRKGMLVFDNTTLADAAAEFNRYNRTKLKIADPAIGRLVVGATFPANDVYRFARSARVLLGVSVVEQNGNIVISR